MSVLTYNGVTLQVCRMADFHMRPVLDSSSVDFLYQHVRLTVQCVWNPAMTASNSVLDGQGNVTAPGDLPALSILNLKQTLQAPGKALRYTLGGQVVFSSPRVAVLGGNRGALIRDAKNGPNVLDVQVLSIHGTHSAIVLFDVEFYVTDCGNDGSTLGGPLISNRWETSESVDPDTLLTTRTTSGTAVFRADLLSAYGQQPDDYRSLVVPPVPDGYKRYAPDITQTRDGLTLEWTVVDEEQVWNLSPTSGITRIEGENWIDNDWVAGTLPHTSMGISVQVWGAKNATRKGLVDTAVAIAATMGFTGDGGLNIVPGLTGMCGKRVVRCAFPQRYASLEISSVLSGQAGGLATWFKNNFGGGFWFSDQMLREDVPPFASAVVGPNVAGGSKGSRGAGLALRMLSQALKQECAKPPQPPGAAPAYDVVGFYP